MIEQPNLHYNTSGSGDINVDEVKSNELYARISGSGEVKVYAIKYLNVTISGSGNVRYNGNPVIDQHISGSGSVIYIKHCYVGYLPGTTGKAKDDA